MAEVNAELTAGGRAALRFGLSLHLGNVTYGNIGAASRLDFTVIGPATNEAARMDNLTKELGIDVLLRSEEHTSELQSLMRISYAVFCLKIKTETTKEHT